MKSRVIRVDGVPVRVCNRDGRPPSDEDVGQITAVLRMRRGEATMAEARDLCGLTDVQAAKVLRVAPDHLRAVERGEVSDPTLRENAARVYRVKGFVDGSSRS